MRIRIDTTCESWIQIIKRSTKALKFLLIYCKTVSLKGPCQPGTLHAFLHGHKIILQPSRDHSGQCVCVHRNETIESPPPTTPYKGSPAKGGGMPPPPPIL